MRNYRYIAYEENGYYSSQQLLDVEQAGGIIPSLLKHYPVHQSVQVYDEDGRIKSCPIFIDLDGTDYDQTKKDAEYIMYSAQEYLKIVPELFFSGNKGFHIIIPHQIEGPRCYLIVKEIVKEIAMACSTVDFQLYRSRSLLRVNKSKASKDGYYKVPIEGSIPDHQAMLEYAKQPRDQKYFCDTSSIDMDLLEEVITESDRKAKIAEAERKEHAKSLYTPMTPCLTSILESPRDGERQHSVYLLAKYYKSQKIDEDTCSDLILNQVHYENFNKEDNPSNQVINTIRRVYDTAKYPIGCRGNSTDAELMRSFCSTECVFNKDVNLEFPTA